MASLRSSSVRNSAARALTMAATRAAMTRRAVALPISATFRASSCHAPWDRSGETSTILVRSETPTLTPADSSILCLRSNCVLTAVPVLRPVPRTDCALRFNAGLSATMMIDWYDFTHDQVYLDSKLWRFLAGVADFYSSYAVRNTTTNKLEFKLTCAQEMCQQR